MFDDTLNSNKFVMISNLKKYLSSNNNRFKNEDDFENSLSQVLSQRFRKNFSKVPPKDKAYLNNLNFLQEDKIKFFHPGRKHQILTEKEYRDFLLNTENLFEGVYDPTRDEKGAFFKNTLKPSDIGGEYNGLNYLLRDLKRKRLPKNTLWVNKGIDSWLNKRKKLDPNNESIKTILDQMKNFSKGNPVVNNDNVTDLYKDRNLLQSLRAVTNQRQKDEGIDDRIISDLRNDLANSANGELSNYNVEDSDLPDVPIGQTYRPQQYFRAVNPRSTFENIVTDPNETSDVNPSNLTPLESDGTTEVLNDIEDAHIAGLLNNLPEIPTNNNSDDDSDSDSVDLDWDMASLYTTYTKLYPEEVLRPDVLPKNKWRKDPPSSNTSEIIRDSSSQISVDGSEYHSAVMQNIDNIVQNNNGESDLQAQLFNMGLNSTISNSKSMSVDGSEYRPEPGTAVDLPSKMSLDSDATVDYASQRSIGDFNKSEFLYNEQFLNFNNPESLEIFNTIVGNIMRTNPNPLPNQMKRFLISLVSMSDKQLKSSYTSAFKEIKIHIETGRIYYKDVITNESISDFVEMMTNKHNPLIKTKFSFDGSYDVFERYCAELESVHGDLDVNTFPFCKFIVSKFNSNRNEAEKVEFRERMKSSLTTIDQITMLTENMTSKQIFATHYADVKQTLEFVIPQNLNSFLTNLGTLNSVLNMKSISDNFGIELNATNGEIFFNSIPTRQMLADFVYDMSKPNAKILPLIQTYYGDVQGYEEYIKNELKERNLEHKDIEHDKHWGLKYLCALYNSLVAPEYRISFKHTVTKELEYDYQALYKYDPNKFFIKMVNKNFDFSRDEFKVDTVNTDLISAQIRVSLETLLNNYKKYMSQSFNQYSNFLKKLDNEVFTENFGLRKNFYESEVYYGEDDALKESLGVLTIIQKCQRENRIYPGAKIAEITKRNHDYQTLNIEELGINFTADFETGWSYMSMVPYYLPTFTSYIQYLNEDEKRDLNDSINAALVELDKNLEYDSLRSSQLNFIEIQNCLIVLNELIFKKPFIFDAVEKLSIEINTGVADANEICSFNGGVDAGIKSIIDIDPQLQSMQKNKNTKLLTVIRELQRINNSEFYIQHLQTAITFCEQIRNTYIRKLYHSMDQIDEQIEKVEDYKSKIFDSIAVFEDNPETKDVALIVSTFTRKNYDKAINYLTNYKYYLSVNLQGLKEYNQYKDTYLENEDNEFVEPEKYFEIEMFDDDNKSTLDQQIESLEQTTKILDTMSECLKNYKEPEIVPIEPEDEQLEIATRDRGFPYDSISAFLDGTRPRHRGNVSEWGGLNDDQDSEPLNILEHRNDRILRGVLKEKSLEKNFRKYNPEDEIVDKSSTTMLIQPGDNNDIKSIKRAFKNNIQKSMKKSFQGLEKIKSINKKETRIHNLDELIEECEHFKSTIENFYDKSIEYITNLAARKRAATDYRMLYSDLVAVMLNFVTLLERKKMQMSSYKDMEVLEKTLEEVESIRTYLKKANKYFENLISEFEVRNERGEPVMQYQYNQNLPIEPTKDIVEDLLELQNEEMIPRPNEQSSNIEPRLSDLHIKQRKENVERYEDVVDINNLPDIDTDGIEITKSDEITDNLFHSVLSWNPLELKNNIVEYSLALIDLQNRKILKYELTEYFKLLFYFYTGKEATWTEHQVNSNLDHFHNYLKEESVIWNRLTFVFLNTLRSLSINKENISIWIEKMLRSLKIRDQLFIKKFNLKTEDISKLIKFDVQTLQTS